MGDGGVGNGSVDSGCHQLSENIWFVWSKMSYSGDMEGCHACARTDGQRTTECEDRARILETEFAKNLNKVQSSEGARRVNISMSTAKQLQPAVSYLTEVCAIFLG